MVYLRPLYVAASTNPQPQLEYIVAVLGKNVEIDTSLSAVLSDLLQTTVSLPSGTGIPSSGTVPTAVAGILAQAQTDYQNALNALKAGNLSAFQSDIQAMAQQISEAQQVIGAPASSSKPTTTTTTPAKQAKPAKSTKGAASTTSSTTSTTSSTATTVPTSIEPKRGTTTTSTTLASAAAARD
jgi:hypothetical protein